MSTTRVSPARTAAFAIAMLLAVAAITAYEVRASAPISATPAASSLQADYTKVVSDVGPSVVMIVTNNGLGSGIVYDATGDIVTNNHVVAGATSLEVVTSSGKTYPATVVGTFAPDDLAVIHVNATGLHPATFADSSRVQVGDIVMAIGNPLGLQSSVTEGIVSAQRTAIPEGGGVTLPTAIQTTAAINPGNSGGALVNLHEQVVGIPTLAATDPQMGGGAAPGIGFAIPSNTVRAIADQLVKTGQVANSGRASLGVTLAITGGHGALVSAVQSGGPADVAGIVPGDIITGIAGQQVSGQQVLSDLLVSLTPGQPVQVQVIHANGSEVSVSVTLGQYQ